MTRYGPCTRCGAMVQTAPGAGSGAGNTRGNALATVAIGGRRVGFVIEGATRTGTPVERLICHHCVTYLMEGGEAAA